jgi:hypothetical protein
MFPNGTGAIVTNLFLTPLVRLTIFFLGGGGGQPRDIFFNLVKGIKI